MAKGVKEKTDQELKLNGLKNMLYDLLDKKSRLELIAGIGPANRKSVEQELSTVENNIVYIQSKMAMTEKELEQTRQEDRDQEKEKDIYKNKLAFMVVTNAKYMEEQKKKEQEEREKTEEEIQEEIRQTVEQLFGEHKFIHVTKDQVDEILNDKEFAQKNYTTKLKHEDIRTAQEIRRMMEREIINSGTALTGDQKKDEEAFIEKMKEPNGFEITVKKMKAGLNSFKDSPEDLKKFEEILEKAEAIAKETRAAQNILIESGRSMRDNGYKIAMIGREKEFVRLIHEFADQWEKKMDAVMDKAAKDVNGDVLNDEDNLSVLKKYAVAKELIYHAERQMRLDEVLERNNHLREKIEKWYIYDKIKNRHPQSSKELKQWIKDEEKAWLKPQRILKESVSKAKETNSKSVEDTGSFTMIETQTLLDRINEHRIFQTKEKERAKEILAEMIIHELIKAEADLPDAKNRPYTTRFEQRGTEETFREMAKGLVASPDFDLILRKVGIKEVTPESCVKFMVNGLDKEILQKGADILKVPYWSKEKKKEKAKEKAQEPAIELDGKGRKRSRSMTNLQHY